MGGLTDGDGLPGRVYRFHRGADGPGWKHPPGWTGRTGPGFARDVTPRDEKPRVRLPVILLFVTIITTVTAGAFLAGKNPVSDPASITAGIPFSAALMLILGTHELGHFLAARRHGVATTLPMFIPGPPFPPPFIGTFGAIIRIKSPITTKRALVDIGAAGPLSGFVVAIVVTFIGLRLSTVGPLVPTGMGLALGDSLLFKLLTYATLGPIREGYEVYLHPVGFAGWIGFFVTAMNLLPLGQLDGGHMVYAILGPFHRLFSMFMVGVLIVLGLLTWPGWIVWAALITIIGMWHPPVRDQHVTMGLRRQLTCAASLAAFVLTFVPLPVYIV